MSIFKGFLGETSEAKLTQLKQDCALSEKPVSNKIFFWAYFFYFIFFTIYILTTHFR